MSKMTHAEWKARAIELFGADSAKWRFVCPCCKHVASVADWKAAGAPEGAIAFSCVGRWSGAKRGAFDEGDGPCNYAGGGLFVLHPVTVTMPDGKTSGVFAFAEV